MEKREFYSQTGVSRSYDELRFGGASGEWVNRRELALIASLLPGKGRVLDLGCGTGRLSLHLAAQGYDVVAVDTSPEMLATARAKEGSERVAWAQGDAFALPVAPATFDAVVALRVAFHFADIGSVLSAAANVVKPGGSVVLDTYNWSPRAVAALGRNTWGPRVYAHRHAAVAEQANRLGLSVQAQTPCFLFSPYIYRRLPSLLLPLLAKSELLLPGNLKARVFWRFQASDPGKDVK